MGLRDITEIILGKSNITFSDYAQHGDTDMDPVRPDILQGK